MSASFFHSEDDRGYYVNASEHQRHFEMKLC